MVIFTDSLSGLLALRKTWQAPHKQELHHELPILTEIVELVANRRRPVIIAKVKGHSGIFGNEVADRVTVMAATGGKASP